jgi:membrane-bound metal-dependent hydrolase YbcI (DUF457 family)
MFVGPLGAALAAKTDAPRTPLATLVGASFGLDLIWPALLTAGVERVRVDPGNTAFTPLAFDSYPWSHSLAAACAWAGLAAWLVHRRRREARGAIVVGAVVVSHWVLDFVTHRADLPLWPGGPMVGLGLWNSVPGTFLVEGLLFALALDAYRRSSRPCDRAGTWLFGALGLFTTAIWMSGPFSPPPPSAAAVNAVAWLLWLFPWWAHGVDRHRVSTGS